MLELIGLTITGVATAVGYLRTRSFVSRRLRYVDAAQRGAMPWLFGGVATMVAAPVVWVLPLVGAGAALLFGAGVGVGAAAGARRIRQRLQAPA